MEGFSYSCKTIPTAGYVLKEVLLISNLQKLRILSKSVVSKEDKSVLSSGFSTINIFSFSQLYMWGVGLYEVLEICILFL